MRERVRDEAIGDVSDDEDESCGFWLGDQQPRMRAGARGRGERERDGWRPGRRMRMGSSVCCLRRSPDIVQPGSYGSEGIEARRRGIVHTFTLILLSLVLLVQFLRFSYIAVVDGV